MSVRILVVEDHPMMRDGVKQAIARESRFELVGEAATGELALKLAAEKQPDFVILDMHLPDMNGIDIAKQILAGWPMTKIVIFSAALDRALVDEALMAGVCGYILKLSAVEELIQAIDLVMAGKLYLSPEVSAEILGNYRQSLREGGEAAKPLLSERDKELLRFVATGQRNKDIAELMQVGIKAVEAHRSRVMKRLGVASSAELVRYAIREGIAKP